MTDQPTQLPAEPAKRPKPPNRPGRPGVKPTPKPKPPTGRPKATPFVGPARGTITVTFKSEDLELTITGPAWKVQKVIEIIFGTVGPPEALIAKLKLVFGPEMVKARM